MAELRPIELLAPAKDLASGVDAVNGGADAVYACGPEFGSLPGAALSLADFKKLCAHARRRKARVYAAVDTIFTDEELPRASALLRRLWEAGAAAAVIQDFGLLETDLPPIPLHAGMRTYIATPAKAAFLAKAGFSRLALPRELSPAEIKAIAAAVPGTGLECFAYGTPCASYSGRCSLSLALCGRSANRGECARPCRGLYTLKGPGIKPGQARPYLSAGTLDLSRRLGGLLDAGVTSFRVEGRVASFRRELDKLMKARGLARAAAPRTRRKVPHAPTDHPYVFKELNFSENVLNHAAEAFYRRHGVKKLERAAEAGLGLAGRKVMTIGRCLRKTLGLCEKGKAAPLFLTDAGGRRLRLEFDCAKCRMFVLLERYPAAGLIEYAGMKAARILLVGGGAELAELCVATLEKENAAHVLMVIDQEHGDRVVSIAEAFKPDAILLLAINHMAPLGGLEVCRQLRASTVAGGAKIILFSSDNLKKGLRAARDCGADAYIPKPFEQEKLVEMLELLLS